MTNPVSDDRLRNTRAWAAARLGSLSGAEVIVAAIDEVFALRAQLAASCDEARSDPEHGGCPLEKRSVEPPDVEYVEDIHLHEQRPDCAKAGCIAVIRAPNRSGDA